MTETRRDRPAAHGPGASALPAPPRHSLVPGNVGRRPESRQSLGATRTGRRTCNADSDGACRSPRNSPPPHLLAATRSAENPPCHGIADYPCDGRIRENGQGPCRESDRKDASGGRGRSPEARETGNSPLQRKERRSTKGRASDALIGEYRTSNRGASLFVAVIGNARSESRRGPLQVPKKNRCRIAPSP